MADDDFEIQISRWADKAGDNLDRFEAAFVLKMTERIKEYTPVLTGRLRSSVAAEKDGTVWTISTNVVYAKRTEYGFNGKDALGREYHQIGVGMFTRAAAEADEIAQEALREIGQ